MPDIRKCAIYGCRSNSRDNKDHKFFNFPTRDSPLYDTWLTICHESEEALRSIRRPYICSDHFQSWHVGFRRLAAGAVPTLNLIAPPGFAEEEKARVAEETAAQKEKERLLNLINDSLLKWVQRTPPPELGNPASVSRRELQRVGMEIRNLLGATLTFNMDDHWLRKFRRTHLSRLQLNDYNDSSASKDQTLDLVDIIKSVDPDANIYGDHDIAILLKREKSIREQKIRLKKSAAAEQILLAHYPPLNYSEATQITKFKEPKKRSFQESLEEFYGIESKDNSHTEVKSIKIESVDLSQDDDEGCFDVNMEDGCSGPKVVSEPIVETYQQALEHLKPLEDFVLAQENYRAIGLLSTLEIIFKNA